MKGTWTTTSGGGVLSAGGVAVLIGAVVAFTERHAIGQALGEAVIIVAAAVAAVVVAVPVAVVFLVRHQRRRGDEVAAVWAAQRAELEAAEDARELRRDQRRLALEQARTPVIHNWIVTDQGARAAMPSPYIPATVINADTQEIPR